LDYLIVRLPASVRFSWRCISKYQERRKRTHHNTGLSEKVVSERRTRPRLPLELLVVIAEYLHHADLVNLSRSSKALRRAFFGDEDPWGVMERLQRYTCGDPAAFPKTACVVCRSPICRVSRSQTASY
jgi:oligoribonuclease (3'-5' exoribonuclease)